MTNIAITCSGTGGHIYPGIALAQAYQEGTCFFITPASKMIEETVARYQFKHHRISHSFKAPWKSIKGVLQVLKHIRKNNIKVMISTGGGGIMPSIIAAKLSGIKVILLEQNKLYGRANRWCHRWADHVCLSFEETIHCPMSSKVIHTGNPLHTALPDPVIEKVVSQPDPNGFKLLVFGGSQGAQAINNWVVDRYSDILEGPYVLIHIIGKDHYKKTGYNGAYHSLKDQSGQTRVTILPYSHDMKRLYAWSDGVISRAGATTIAELQAYGKPALLIPYPYATDNHQEANTDVLVASGQGVHYPQERLINSPIKEVIQSFPQEKKIRPQPSHAIKTILEIITHP